MDGCLDGCQAVIDTCLVPRSKTYFASAALCNGAFPLLTRFQNIFADTPLILKTRIPCSPLS